MCLKPEFCNTHNATMYFFKDFAVLFYAYSVAIGGVAATAPLCSESIEAAGGGQPNSILPTEISANAMKGLQFAHFLKNMEVSFFNAGLKNLTEWGASGLRNDTMEIVSKIAAVSTISFSDIVPCYNICVATRGPCFQHRENRAILQRNYGSTLHLFFSSQ